MTRPITERQAQVLDFIRAYHDEHGVAPSLREIGSGCGFASTNAAFCFLGALERKGAISRIGGISRGIRLVEDAFGPGRCIVAITPEAAELLDRWKSDDATVSEVVHEAIAAWAVEQERLAARGDRDDRK